MLGVFLNFNVIGAKTKVKKDYNGTYLPSVALDGYCEWAWPTGTVLLLLKSAVTCWYKPLDKKLLPSPVTALFLLWEELQGLQLSTRKNFNNCLSYFVSPPFLLLFSYNPAPDILQECFACLTFTPVTLSSQQ